MSADYERAARGIVSYLGRDGARAFLNLVEQDGLGAYLAAAVERWDEDAIASALAMVSAVLDAAEQIAREEGKTYRDLGKATRDAILRRLVAPLKRQLDSGE